MKKYFALLLTVVLLLTLISCDEGKDPPSGNSNSSGASQERVTEEIGGGDRGEESTDRGGSSSADGLTQVAMETEILRRLSAISSLKSLTLCGGDQITYTPDGMIMAGDWWVIKNPTMGKDEFMTSIETQLTAAGFTVNHTLMGTEYTVKAGPGRIGISIMFDTDSSELTLRTTNHRDEYTMAFIEAENAKLPTIIEGVDIIDKLPENFSIGFKTSTDRYVVCRYEGGYYVESESLDTSGDYHFVHYYAAVLQTDGSYLFYNWSNMTKNYNNSFEAGKPEQREYFMSSSDGSVPDQINKQLERLSTWVRMSWDYKDLPVDGDRFIFDRTCQEYSISENMTKVGNETYLGRSCEKVHSEGLWADTYDIIFDLETGMVMKMTVQNSGQGEVETYVEVTEYNENPTALGKFVMP